jgi:uncharacterized cofD-like protein
MKKVVTITGGTGGYALLTGLKDIPGISITSIVCMTDSGGTTGTLRDDLGVLPPGDVRQCLTALSDETDVVRKLMSYRFAGGTLGGFSFGSIFLAALEKVAGDLVSGVEIAARILKTRGTVVPVLTKPATLQAILKNGEWLEGEYAIYTHSVLSNPIARVRIKERVEIHPHAAAAILPSLLVKSFSKAVQTSRAKIVYIVNLTNRSGHTVGWSAQKYVSEIESALGRKVSAIVLNTEKFSAAQTKMYTKKEGEGLAVLDDLPNDTRVLRKKLVSRVQTTKRVGDVNVSYIRHDSTALKNAIAQVVARKPKKVHKTARVSV